MAYLFEVGQLVALLQNWNYSVFCLFFVATIASIVSVVFYKKGLPSTENVKKINNILARIAAPNLMLDTYQPQDNVFKAITPSPNHPVLEIFGLEPELFCAANYTDYNTPPSCTSEVLLKLLHKQTEISDIKGVFLCVFVALTSVLGSVSLYISWRNNKNCKAQELSDTQLIAHLTLQLNRVKSAKKDIEAALQLAQKEVCIANSDLYKSTKDRNRLEKRVIELTYQREEASKATDGLDEALKAARETIKEEASLVTSTIKRLEAQSEHSIKLETEKIQLDRLLSEQLWTSTELQIEKNNLEQEVEKQLETIHQEKYELYLQLQAANSKIEELAQQNAELITIFQTLSARNTKMREFLHKTENRTCALDVQVRDLTRQNYHLAHELNSSRDAYSTYTPVPPVDRKVVEQDTQENSIIQDKPSPHQEDTAVIDEGQVMPPRPSISVVGVTRRKFRKTMFSHYQTKTALLAYNDWEIYELQLPCHDSHYRDEHIPLPAQVPLEMTIVNGKPIEALKMNAHGKEVVFQRCRECREWYTKKDRNDHQLVCRDFFDRAAFCPHCGKIFRNNNGFCSKHLPACEKQHAGGLQ